MKKIFVILVTLAFRQVCASSDKLPSGHNPEWQIYAKLTTVLLLCDFNEFKNIKLGYSGENYNLLGSITHEFRQANVVCSSQSTRALKDNRPFSCGGTWYSDDKPKEVIGTVVKVTFTPSVLREPYDSLSENPSDSLPDLSNEWTATFNSVNDYRNKQEVTYSCKRIDPVF